MLRTFASAEPAAGVEASGVGGREEAVLLAKFRDAYVAFMTTPGSHNDSYASTCHRMFFANMVSGRPLDRCPDNDGHNVDTMDALTLAVPVVLGHFAAAGEGGSVDEQAAAAAALAAVRVTRHVSPAFEPFCAALVGLLLAALRGEDLRGAVETAARRSLGASYEAGTLAALVARGDEDPVVACYVDSGFFAMLFMLHKYADADLGAAALANANAGGENVARGALLGAVFGARPGAKGSAAGWCSDGLLHGKDIDAEINAFLLSSSVAAGR